MAPPVPMPIDQTVHAKCFALCEYAILYLPSEFSIVSKFVSGLPPQPAFLGYTKLNQAAQGDITCDNIPMLPIKF